MTALLEAVGATHRHPSRAGARGGVAELDLALHEGRAVGLVGPSGAGKSTALGLLLGQLPTQRGEVRWRGTPLRAGRGGVRRLRPLRRDVQLVPQDPAQSLDPRWCVERLVAEPLRRLGVPGDHDRRIAAALDAVGLEPGLRRHRPAELSGGQAQRVAVARALATGARLLLADEPVSGLDPERRDQVLATFEHLVAEHGVGLLLVSHDLDAVARTCPELVVLADARVVERGPTQRVLEHPTHDVTAALVAARPRPPVCPGAR